LRVIGHYACIRETPITERTIGTAVLSLFIWIVTIVLVAVAGVTGVYALFILGYSVSFNLTDAQGSMWGALVSAIAGLSIPAAGVSAFWIARRQGLRGRLMAMLVAGVIYATVMGLYMLYLELIVVFGP
jgi:hypothetical protein